VTTHVGGPYPQYIFYAHSMFLKMIFKGCEATQLHAGKHQYLVLLNSVYSLIFQHSAVLHIQGQGHLSIYLFIYLSLLVVLGFELRTSHLLGKHSTSWAMPQPSFFSVYFLDKVLCFCPGPSLNLKSSASFIIGLTGICHHTQTIFLRKVSLTFLTGLFLSLYPPISTS
jgi:hypothetical protein